MMKRRVIIALLICTFAVIWVYFQWTKHQFEVRVKSYLAEAYPDDRFEIQIEYDYKFRKFIGIVKPVHSNFTFQVRSAGGRLISNYGNRYWRYLVSSQLDVYLKKEIDYKAYSRYHILDNYEFDFYNAEGERILYQDIKDQLTSAYLIIYIGSYPLTETELAKILTYIRDEGIMFFDLSIVGEEWHDDLFEIRYEYLHNVPIERIISEWKQGLLPQP